MARSDTLLAQAGKLLGDLFRTDPAQVFFVKAGRHLLHFPGNGRIVIRQIRMATAGIHHGQGIALLGEIIVQGAHHRIVRLEVNEHQAARRGSHLIQQAAGLAKVYVFRILGYLGPKLVVNGPAVVQLVQNSAGKHFKGG